VYKVKIIDNCISSNQQNLIIKELLQNTSFPWHYREDITDDTNIEISQKRPAFSHYFILNKKPHSPAVNLILPIINSLTKKQIIQCRSFLQIPLNPKIIGSKHDTPHTDFSYPHTVYLYYVIDADGDTLLFKNSKIVKKITPKKGRLIIFNGEIEHTACQPKKGIRCIINFDVEK
jgi:hypothetical protein|tara:strand:- start:259 stop:783 length:525 start_codon:yes stop_codon:yes gene_type:complete